MFLAKWLCLKHTQCVQQVCTQKAMESIAKQLVRKAALVLHPLLHWQQLHFCGDKSG